MAVATLACATAPANAAPSIVPPIAAAAPCDAIGLTIGPAFTVAANDRFWIDRTHEALKVLSAGDRLVYDLSKSHPTEVKEHEAFHKVAAGEPDKGDAGHAGDGTNVPHQPSTALRESAMVLPNGRPLAVSRLYANIYAVKVGSQDRQHYDAFVRDLLGGEACGVPLGSMPPDLKSRLKPTVAYALFDAITAGKLDDFAGWMAYRPVFATFLSIAEIEEFLEIYGYRASEQGGLVPGLTNLDPNKLWTFAWNAAAKLFGDLDFTEFSDLSAFQSGGELTFTILGSQPIEGGQGNKYGFYTKAAGAVSAGTVQGTLPLSWMWKQADDDYLAKLSLKPPSPRVPPIDRLDAARNALVILDVTLDRIDVVTLVQSYQAYFASLGYRFGPEQDVVDVPRYVSNTIADGKLDLLTRDGHADGDDTHAMVLYPVGRRIEGLRTLDGRTDRVDIVFNLDDKAKFERLAYADFAAALQRRFAQMGKPLTYVDGSCWGFYKAWFTLGAISASQLVVVSSKSPVNFFENSSVNAMRNVVDGLMKGVGFATLHARLSTLPTYASGQEDRFVLPDEALYPRSGLLLKVDPHLFRRHLGDALSPYLPDGYL